MIQSFSGMFRRLFLFYVMLFSAGCTLEALLEKDISSKITDEVIPISITMDVGATKLIEPSGGTPPFTYQASTSGYLNTSTGAYSIPVNAQVMNETFEVIDSMGKKFSVTVRRKGFREFRRIELPQSASQDQNYVTDAVWLTSGKVLATAIGSDYDGERWATYRSDNDGASWSRVDQFMGYHYHGESHPLAMTAKGNTVFVCGYAYKYNYTSADPLSGWFVRKSTDEGTTWSTSDHWWEVPQMNHVCYDIAVSPTTGYIYAVGYTESTSEMVWVIRESKDDGETWNTIYKAAPVGGGGEEVAYQIKVTPSGHLFVLGAANSIMYFLKGTFSAGAWTWTPATSIPGAQIFGDYQLRGNLQVLDDNNAYFSCRHGVSGKVYRTTDGGDNWSEVYVGQNYLQGMTVTASGKLIATGGSRSPTNDWKVVSSPDGVTWTPIDLDATLAPPNEPHGITIVAHPTANKVLAMASNKRRYQAAVAYSNDDGTSWSLASEIRFQWAFYSFVSKIIRTSATQLFSIWETGDMDGNWPWVIKKSSDNGITWQDADHIVTALDDTKAADIIQGHDDNLYVIGRKDSNAIIRRSADGTIWTDVHSFASGAWEYALAMVKNSATYFAAKDGLNIIIGKTTNGVTWSAIKTFSPPGGVNEMGFQSLTVDAVGNLYLLAIERVGAAGTVVLHRSTDGGTTWVEALRGPSQPSYWNISSTLKVSPVGEIYVYEGASMFTSTDNGGTWSAYTNVPSNVLDIGWSGSTAYFLATDPTEGTAVFTEGFTPGSWILIESVKQRFNVGENVGEYDIELMENKFYSLSSLELLLNYNYNDAYFGARSILRMIDTSQ